MPADDSTTIPAFFCIKCNNEFPRTSEYFKPHKQVKDGLDTRCRNCVLKSDREWRSKNREHVNQKSKEYAQNHPNQRKATCNRYYQTHKEKCLAHEKAHYLETRDVHLAKGKEYRQRNIDTIRCKARERYHRNKDKYQQYYASHRHEYAQKSKLWKQKYADKVRYYNNKRRAIKLNAEGHGLPFDEKDQLKRQKNKCYYCRRKLSVGKYHIEHIVPLSRGGSDYPDNKVIACMECNLSKQNKLPHEWSKGGRLL